MREFAVASFLIVCLLTLAAAKTLPDRDGNLGEVNKTAGCSCECSEISCYGKENCAEICKSGCFATCKTLPNVTLSNQETFLSRNTSRNGTKDVHEPTSELHEGSEDILNANKAIETIGLTDGKAVTTSLTIVTTKSESDKPEPDTKKTVTTLKTSTSTTFTTAKPKTTLKPKTTTTPKTTVKLKQTTTTTPTATTMPKTTAKPKQTTTTTPKTTTPRTTATPNTTVKPKATTITTKPPTTTPKESLKPKTKVHKTITRNTTLKQEEAMTLSTPRSEASNSSQTVHSESNVSLLKNITYNEAITHFTQNIFAEISTDHGNNFVFSPLSLHIALSILARGGTVKSATKKELLAALGYTDGQRLQQLKEAESAYVDIFKRYQAEGNEVLTIANGLWVATSHIEQNFVNLLSKSYGAEVFKLQGNKNVTFEINEWVKNSTKGKIERIADSIDSDAVLFLANAVHFKEAWTVAFDEVPDPVDFALSNGNVKKVKMMERISSSLATKSFTFKKVLPDVKMTLVVLPYSTANGRFEMHIVMPGKSGSLDQIMDYLTSTKEKEREAIFLTIQQAKKSIVTRNIESTLRMPFFSVKSQIGVEKYLRKLGVRAAFDEGHFNQIAKVPLRLSSVSHVASIDVTLDGTLGAAATGFELTPYSLGFDEPVNVTIDKPFIFIITDTDLDTIIFAGSIKDPTQDGSDPRD